MTREPMGRVALAAVLAAGLMGRHPVAAAQQAVVEARAGRFTDERGGVHAGVTLAPTLGWSAPAGRLTVGAQGTAFRGGGLLGSVGGRAEAVLVEGGGLGLVMGAEGSAAGSDAGYRAAAGTLLPMVRLTAPGWGIELGGRLQRGGEGFGSSAGAPGAGLLPFAGRRDAGMRWRAARGVEAGAWLDRGVTGARAGWRTMATDGAAWSEWSGAVSARLELLTLGLSGGVRTGDVAEGWVGASAAVAAGTGAEVVVEAGRAPSDPLMGRVGGEYASVGLRLRTGSALAAAAPVRPAAVPGSARVSLRAAPGARVEVLADWNEWRPQVVAEVSPGEYRLELPLPEGVYRYAFRVDGEWRVPRGVETEPDEYGGRRAVLRVRGRTTDR